MFVGFEIVIAFRENERYSVSTTRQELVVLVVQWNTSKLLNSLKFYPLQGRISKIFSIGSYPSAILELFFRVITLQEAGIILVIKYY